MTPREAQTATTNGSMIVQTRSGAEYEVEREVVEFYTTGPVYRGSEYVYGFRVNGPRTRGPFAKHQPNGTVRWFLLKNVQHVPRGTC